MKEHVDNLIECIPKNSEVVDLQPLFFRFTLDTTTAFLLGESVYSLQTSQEGRGAKFAHDFNIAQDYVIKRFRLLDLYWIIGGREFREACKSVQCFVEEMIEQRQGGTDRSQEKLDRYIFFDAVAQDTKDKDELRDQLINILLAGRDTTACLLSWTL